MKRDRKPSTQTLSLLGVLLEQPRSWRHGYDISIATAIKSGTLYPILMRLSDRGFLEHKWQGSDTARPPRHVYRLTAGGAAYARAQIAANEWARVLPTLSRSRG
ncbi:MAG TPA: PadR family transcriptional regulator [Steroidobacteraceae bacterium]|jgi:DNA-binding PadR family transcriptional regulator|nr:PadR family transcriptional regulator [Steroidobacteraceae bacterium]